MPPSQPPEEHDAQGLYPIRTVSSLTGVNPVTLRAWERRYGLIKPQRTPKGHRLYAEADIARVRRILKLLEQGIPIGQTRRLLDAETALPARQPLSESVDERPWERYRERMIDAIARFDDSGLEAAYNEALSLYPVALVTRSLIAPLGEELRRRQRGGDDMHDAERRFFNAYLRNKLGARLHHAMAQARGPRLVAAGLPGDRDESELLLFALEAMAYGYRIVLLGRDMPLAPLATVAERTQARAIALHGTALGDGDALAALVAASRCPVFVSGPAAASHNERIHNSGAHTLAEEVGEAMHELRNRLGS